MFQAETFLQGVHFSLEFKSFIKRMFVVELGYTDSVSALSTHAHCLPWSPFQKAHSGPQNS